MAATTMYLIPLLALATTTEVSLRRRIDALPLPAGWVVFAGTQLTLSLISAMIGSALTLLLGIVATWRELFTTNRLVVVLTVLVGGLFRFYRLTRSGLEARNRELQQAVESDARVLRLHEQDFERAREIQQALMPAQLPQIPGCRLAAGCQPARIVGGDYYDAVRCGDSAIAIALGDVSGKGMGAALLMSNLQAIVRAFAPGGLQPHELCAKANRLIAANVAPGKYITFFYGVVDVAGMRLDYCNAGHNPPILQHRDGTWETLGEGGPVLGVFPQATYVSATAKLRPRDCLVLFTDGITEAMDANGQEFGEEALMALLRPQPESAEECRSQIVAAVTQFASGGFHDDATLLVMTMN
jgi:sigma-B regulation protein RsbU (phosphoserine phosphatase)